jgi:aminomethyltransferase
LNVAELHITPLNALHRARGAKMVPFAGYDMPVQYEGVMAEHLWTRSRAGLFDVAHMGQAFLHGPDHATTAAALERLCPGDFQGLKLGQMRYSVLLAEDGGALDDLMVTRLENPAYDGRLFLVVNAACKDADYAYIAKHLPAGVRLEPRDFALLALQGPSAHQVCLDLFPDAADLTFMTTKAVPIAGTWAQAFRSGYTGEDGFELSVKAEDAVKVAEALLAHPEVKPIGLGARDSLRLEAGLCLYGHDMTPETSPIGADVAFAVSKRRRAEGGFFGAERILAELANGPATKRVGLTFEGRQPAREGAPIHKDGQPIGVVTSGTFSPTLQAPVAMGYVLGGHAAIGTSVEIIVRDKPLSARIAPMPFVPHRYRRA